MFLSRFQCAPFSLSKPNEKDKFNSSSESEFNREISLLYCSLLVGVRAIILLVPKNI